MATLLALILAVAAEPVRSAHVVITVRAPERVAVLRGRADLRRGYRFIGRDGRTVFALARRRDGGFEQVLQTTLGARQGPIWLDDHPPTLPLTRRGLNPIGAEAFAHLALLALTEATPEVGRVDFAGLYRRPPRYDDGRFIMRPFLRSVGTLPVTWSVDGDHRVRGLSFTVPPSTRPFRRWGRPPGAEVDVRLTRLDTVPRLRRPSPGAIE